MNILYQLSGSLWTIAVAIAFVIAARRVRPFEPKINISEQSQTYQSVHAPSHGPTARQNEASEDNAMQFLIMNGVWRGRRPISLQAAENGLVYWSNLPRMRTSLRTRHVYMLGSADRIMARQLLSPIPSSGLIFAHLLPCSISAV